MMWRELVCDPEGRLSEAKLWANMFKAAMTYTFVTHSESIIKDWTVLAVFVCGVIAPDLLKKLLMLKAGKEVK